MSFDEAFEKNFGDFLKSVSKGRKPTSDDVIKHIRSEKERKLQGRIIPLPQMLNPQTSEIIAIIVLGELNEYEALASYNNKSHCIDVAISYRSEETNSQPVVLVGATFAAIDDGSGLLTDMSKEEAFALAGNINTAFANAMEPYLDFLRLVRMGEIILTTDDKSVNFNKLSGVIQLPKD